MSGQSQYRNLHDLPNVWVRVVNLGSELRWAIDHVFLPPQLPQNGNDLHLPSHETALLYAVSNSLLHFKWHLDPEMRDPGVHDAIEAARLAIRRLNELRQKTGFVDEERLKTEIIRTMKGEGK